MTRHTNEPHDRNRTRPTIDPSTLRPILPWMPEASRSVADSLRAFAAKYPDRFEYRDGKLQQRRKA